jgi:quercetin dioxygenase-like cupin family protein
MLNHANEGPEYRELLPGVELKTVAHGERTLMGKFKIAEGAVIPVHSHPQEQTGYLVTGRLRFDIDGEEITVEPGSGWCLEPNLPHGATALEDCVVIEVFSPRRDDYLPD